MPIVLHVFTLYLLAKNPKELNVLTFEQKTVVDVAKSMIIYGLGVEVLHDHVPHDALHDFAKEVGIGSWS